MRADKEEILSLICCTRRRKGSPGLLPAIYAIVQGAVRALYPEVKEGANRDSHIFLAELYDLRLLLRMLDLLAAIKIFILFHCILVATKLLHIKPNYMTL